ncbi:unnamed protein product [Penicillium olsonii]|nr:unnamed protein product [Penicillium olsonii]
MACIRRGQRALPSPLNASRIPIARYLSTTPQPNKPTDTVTIPSKTDLNAPISTLPIDLVTPPPIAPSAALADKLKRYVEFGRTYLTFYKTGLKNVYRNYRASLPLRAQLGLPAYLPVSPPRESNASQQSKYSQLGRGQFQLVCRSARDVRRMIPFTLILIVCGEFTPLIVPIFGSAITPATCRVPSQVEKERIASSKRKVAALRAAGVPVSVDAEQMGALAGFVDLEWVAKAQAADVLRACAVFGLVKSHEKVGGAVLAGLVYRPRLARYAEYLAVDDGMIRAGGVAGMSATEVRIAVEERGGVDVSGAFDGKQAEGLERRWLQQWLALREKKSVQ